MIGFGSITVSTINAVDETEIYYYQSSSPTDLADGSWSMTRPTWEDGKYVWQKTKTIYKDGTSSESQPVNITGQQGVGVSSVQRYYKMTDSLPAQPTDVTILSWSTTEPQYIAGSTDNIYTVEKIVYADGTTSYSDVSLSASFVAAKQAYELANGVNDKVTSVYGTCSTSANTAKKEVVCAGFELYQGARIQVSFNYSNSASIPTLDVNNTGEKNIYLINTIIDSSNQLYWTTNAKIDFVYNGTGWVLQNVPVGLYGVCNSNSNTVAKEVICGEAVICKGTYLSVLMNNNNTATAPTLNVASTVACAIKANNSTLSSDSIYNWRANFIQNFIFDGQYWIMCDDIAKYDSNEAKKEATNYLSIDNTGIMIADMSTGQQYSPSNVPTGIKNTFIDNDSLDIRDGQKILSSFGERDIIQYDQNGAPIFWVSQFPTTDTMGIRQAVHETIYDLITVFERGVRLKYYPQTGTKFNFSIIIEGTTDDIISENHFNIPNFEPNEEETIYDKSVTIDYIAENRSGGGGNTYGYEITLDCNHNYALFYISNYTFSNTAKVRLILDYFKNDNTTFYQPYYSFGTRYSYVNAGIYSFVEGYYNTANGKSTHAEGYYTTANGDYSHSEGSFSFASGEMAHAEGYSCTATGNASHAEGDGTEASNLSAHAEGSGTIASGVCSHAQNKQTIAASQSQTALGRYNIADSQNKYVFIVGNGTTDNTRSNAFAITWDGDTEFALDTTASSGTIDADLYDAITALGWENDVTV